MGTVKLEFDLPDFKDQVEVKINISKDGVLLGTSPTIKINDYKSAGDVAVGVWKQQAAPSQQITYPVENYQSSNIPKSMTGEY